jgi:hypothetical protein
MRSEKKNRDWRQQRLAFVKKGLWEKLPQPSRVRCRELIVELLRAVLLARYDAGRKHERED